MLVIVGDFPEQGRRCQESGSLFLATSRMFAARHQRRGVGVDGNGREIADGPSPGAEGAFHRSERAIAGPGPKMDDRGCCAKRRAGRDVASGLFNAHPPSMSIRLFAPVLMALGIVGMTVAVIWWYDYYIELKELLGARTPPPLECLYKIIQPCRFADAVPAWEGGVRPYRPELLWIAALSFMIGSGMEFVQVVRRELEAPDQKPTRDIS